MKQIIRILPLLLIFFGCSQTSAYQKTIIPFADSKHGLEPWITDLTVKNTKLLKNISPKDENSYSYPYDKVGSIEMGCFHYFLTDWALYKSNGSKIGTKIDDNINDFKFSKLVKFNNKLYFSLSDQPSIFEVHPQEGYSASEIYYFNQSKHKRKVVDFVADAYGKNLLMLVSRELKQGAGFVYELYLGDAKGNEFIQLDFELDTLAEINLLKLFVTKSMIYLLGEDGSIWRCENSETLPDKKVYFLPYEPKREIERYSIISDENNFYFYNNKYIYKSNESEFAKAIIKEPLDADIEFHKVFNNHLIYTATSSDYKNFYKKLCELDLKTGKSQELAQSVIPYVISDPPPVFKIKFDSSARFEYFSDKFERKEFSVVKIVLDALENNKTKALQNIIHPKHGIILSANTFFDDASLHFSKNYFIDIYDKKETLYWGEDETKGDRINMSLSDYLQILPAGTKDVSKVKELKEFKNFPRKDIKGYEIYWVGKDNPEYSWSGLVVILQEYQGEWYVVGMLVDYWTP
jgi:ELWxxDGT repeat protein